MSQGTDVGDGQADDGHAADFRRGQREKLARMAGQIADFFKSYPDEQAVPAIAEHINQFWSRRMRADFLAGFSPDSPELSPLLRKALAGIRRPASES